MLVHANKVVIVTGASSGIGAATVKKFTAEGAKVAIVARNESKITKVCEDCEKIGHKPLPIIADLIEETNIRHIVNSTIKEFGKIDILVNNAASPGNKTSILHQDCMQWLDSSLAINLKAAIKLVQLAAPYIVESRGNIVNISSIASIKPMAINFPYCVAKAALDQFTKCIAYELGSKGVRVNSILPGPVRTDIYENLGKGEIQDKLWEKLREGTATGYISRPEDIAEMISFVSSEKARGLTGAMIVQDCGYMLKGTFK